MGRIASPLAEGENLFQERIPKPERVPFGRRNGLKRSSLRDSWKRKLLAMPPQKREEARQKSLKRTPIKRRESKGRKAELQKYYASAPAFFAEPGNDVCLICVKLREDGDDIILRPATIRHHVRGRIGRLLNWRPGQIPSCKHHEPWPHAHPARARKLGLLSEAVDWNHFPDAGRK